MSHIVSFRMSDDELRERLSVKDDEVLDGDPGIYPHVNELDGSLVWIIEATKKREVE